MDEFCHFVNIGKMYAELFVYFDGEWYCCIFAKTSFIIL